MAPAHGGGGDHGNYSWTSSYFVPLKSDAGKVVPRGGCSSNIAAGENDGKRSLHDVNMVVHVGCRHEIAYAIVDVPFGEKLICADTLVEASVKPQDGRPLWLGYDVICKYMAHRKVNGLPEIDLGFLPAFHAYSHDTRCQAQFGPRSIMGTGTTLDGEGHERTNSVLSRSIASTRFETAGNRQQDIAWLLEYNNRKKEASYITLVTKAAKTAFTQAQHEYDSLNGCVDSYASNLLVNTSRRTNIVKNIALARVAIHP
ncbi:hypothetical protein SPRG_20436 [Saprolegnia parasitica CBS 223.65]|uniref:Uncharacterized protein n=1 Tax=Saprolegnia parasitica (strain CBS 223.65) TaxID=695850 RepID=A0A067C829_SAPPC|nr:hypothetical protein SPRG_20436 [Saprolegnia parasitica CBS 223.65]KDO26934.1 hypothetical protein SPRG_20436 [Saprolegnia parasitica CBS 223.65]|eukprot:XP_012202413.1 hypothetical protein SPRG_20436 [Saprolegnia parasitica CBS 223.65]